MGMLAIGRTGLLCAALSSAVGCTGLLTPDLSFSPFDEDAGCPAEAPTPAHASTSTTGGCPSWTCDPGWADCGGGPCSANLAADPQQCGDCGNACAGGTCVMGSCQRVDTLAANLSAPAALALDSAAVYWIDQPSGATLLERVSLGGGDVQSLTRLPGPVLGLAVDGTGIYCLAQTGSGDSSEVAFVPPPSTAASPRPLPFAEAASSTLQTSLAVGGGRCGGSTVSRRTTTPMGALRCRRLSCKRRRPPSTSNPS